MTNKACFLDNTYKLCLLKLCKKMNKVYIFHIENQLTIVRPYSNVCSTYLIKGYHTYHEMILSLNFSSDLET